MTVLSSLGRATSRTPPNRWMPQGGQPMMQNAQMMTPRPVAPAPSPRPVAPAPSPLASLSQSKIPFAPPGAQPPMAPKVEPATGLGMDPEQDKWLALLMGGLNMMEAAGTPGASAMSSLAAGGKGGVQALLDVQQSRRGREAAASKLAMDKELLEIKRTQAAAAYNKSITDTATTMARNVMSSLGPNATQADFQAAMKQQLATKDTEMERYIDSLPNEAAKKKAREDWFKKRTHIGDSTIKQLTDYMNASKAKVETQRDKLISTANIDHMQSGRGAMDTLENVHRMRQLIFSGKLKTGAAKPTFDLLQSWAKDLGGDLSGILGTFGIQLSRTSTQEQFNAAAKALVAANVKKMGANPSNADLKLLQEQMANSNMTEEANLGILDRISRQAEEAMSYGGTAASDLYKGHEDAGILKRYTQRAGQLREQRESMLASFEPEIQALATKRQSGTATPEDLTRFRQLMAYRNHLARKAAQ